MNICYLCYKRFTVTDAYIQCTTCNYSRHKECPGGVNTSARPIKFEANYSCDWCFQLDCLFADCPVLNMPNLSRLNVISTVMDRNFHVINAMLIGLERWIEDAEESSSMEDQRIVDVSAVKKSEWICMKLVELSKEQKPKKSRRVFRNVLTKQLFCPISLPDLVAKTFKCEILSPREAAHYFIDLLIAAHYLTELKIIPDDDTIQYYDRCWNEMVMQLRRICLCPDHFLREWVFQDNDSKLTHAGRSLVLGRERLNPSFVCTEPHRLVWNEEKPNKQLALVMKKFGFEKRWLIVPFSFHFLPRTKKGEPPSIYDHLEKSSHLSNIDLSTFFETLPDNLIQQEWNHAKTYLRAVERTGVELEGFLAEDYPAKRSIGSDSNVFEQLDPPNMQLAETHEASYISRALKNMTNISKEKVKNITELVEDYCDICILTYKDRCISKEEGEKFLATYYNVILEMKLCKECKQAWEDKPDESDADTVRITKAFCELKITKCRNSDDTKEYADFLREVLKH